LIINEKVVEKSMTYRWDWDLDRVEKEKEKGETVTF
jgi:hypothetical protein